MKKILISLACLSSIFSIPAFAASQQTSNFEQCPSVDNININKNGSEIYYTVTAPTGFSVKYDKKIISFGGYKRFLSVELRSEKDYDEHSVLANNSGLECHYGIDDPVGISGRTDITFTLVKDGSANKSYNLFGAWEDLGHQLTGNYVHICGFSVDQPVERCQFSEINTGAN